jgi:predicted  nucleic acid-binding Zn-ribbon protein
MMEVDEQTRDYFDRLLAETTDARRALEEKVDRNTDRILTVLDSHSRQFDHLTAEYYSGRAALSRVEETVARLEASVARLEHDFRENRVSYTQLLEDVRDIRARLDATHERLTQIESAARRDHDA